MPQLLCPGITTGKLYPTLKDHSQMTSHKINNFLTPPSLLSFTCALVFMLRCHEMSYPLPPSLHDIIYECSITHEQPAPMGSV